MTRHRFGVWFMLLFAVRPLDTKLTSLISLMVKCIAGRRQNNPDCFMLINVCVGVYVSVHDWQRELFERNNVKVAHAWRKEKRKCL